MFDKGKHILFTKYTVPGCTVPDGSDSSSIININNNIINNIHSNEVKILKKMWMIGPSKAVISKGKCIEVNNQSINSVDGSDPKAADSNNTHVNDSATNNTGNSNEGYSSYSILDAFIGACLFNEDSKPDKQDEHDDELSNNTSTKFVPGKIMSFDIGIDGEGFTEWKIVFNERSKNIERAIEYIKKKQFKAAFTIASKGVESEGFIPISAETYIAKVPSGQKNIQPPFIGHCKYAIDAGSEGGNSDKDRGSEGLTICLAVAPINGRTNKPSEDMVLQAIYNVTGDITGGALGNLLATITGKLRDKSSGDRDRYGGNSDKDSDSEASKSDELSKFLHKKFNCVGDHTMYGNFLTLRKFIKKQLSEGNLELESFNVDGKEIGINIDNIETALASKKFASFF